MAVQACPPGAQRVSPKFRSLNDSVLGEASGGLGSIAPVRSAEKPTLGRRTPAARISIRRVSPSGSPVQRLAGRRRDPGLDLPLGLLLEHHCACGQPVVAAHVADAQPDQVAGAQLAVDPQIEQGEVAQVALLRFSRRHSAVAEPVDSWQRCYFTSSISFSFQVLSNQGSSGPYSRNSIFQPLPGMV